MTLTVSIFGREILEIRTDTPAPSPEQDPKDLIGGEFGFGLHRPVHLVDDPVKRWDPGTEWASPDPELGVAK
ncbi:hypothetical protein DW322_11175 [Rhodococcus rhodnii]|uniref:Uncharacterized protein n=2 Tax=Rhodococcus rhodnii TaxID=38312 RepID=R7WRY5_9NOCA|nr:hypothetical protein [Rhodococcus rhodnii]EOM78045.1 hypothetical protein Rrhod_0586 [Rhodococcus rhodnii LMG 5362]TXG90673.1 hypothetical protein DW322_11175 [Rhodococcus rhodnii]